MSEWELVARVERDRFPQGAPVPLELRLRNASRGVLIRPPLEGGAPHAPRLELVRDGGVPRIVRTDHHDAGGFTPPGDLVGPGQTTTGVLDVEHFARPLAPGNHVVTAVLPEDGTRSNPVAFTVEASKVRALVAAPVDGSGLGAKILLRAEEREGAVALVLDRPGLERRESIDVATLAQVPSGLAVSLAPPDRLDPRAWALALVGGELFLWFVDGNGTTHGAPPVVHGLTDARLVGALAGELVEPAAGGSPDGQPWPRLHAALTGRGAAGHELVAIGLSPVGLVGGKTTAPTVERRPLAAVPLATAGVALDGEARLLVAVLPRPQGFVAEAWPWARTLGTPVRVLEAAGVFRSLDAVATQAGARVEVLEQPKPVAPAPGSVPAPGGAPARGPAAGSAPSPALVLHRLLLDAKGVGVPRSLALLLAQIPPGVQSLRLRIAGDHRTVILAVQRAGGRAVAFSAGSPEASPIPIAGSFWDVEVDEDQVRALGFDTTEGLVREVVEPPV